MKTLFEYARANGFREWDREAVPDPFALDRERKRERARQEREARKLPTPKVSPND